MIENPNVNNSQIEPVAAETYTVPADQAVGLYLGMAKDENLEAITLADQAGLIISIVPTTLGSHPELLYKGGEYYGLEAIRKALVTQSQSGSLLDTKEG